MKNILIFLFICFGFALNSQITITCYECKKNTTVDCKGCNIQSNLFTGIVIKEKGKPDIPLYEPYKVSNKSSVFTFEDAFGTKTIVNVTSVLSYNTPKKLYDYLSNCLCKPSTIDTDTDRYSVLIQDSILVTYDINGVEIDRDTIRLFDIDTDTKTFLVQDSILVYYDIQNNEIGRDTIKIPFVDTDIQTYLTQDSILVYYDESNTEIGRDTIRIPSIASITEQGDFRISNDTLYHNNSIDGIEQFVKLPTLDTTTQSYLPILNGLDTIGYENITYLGGVEVDRDTITLPLHKNQVKSNETQAVPYTGVELPTTPGVNIGDTNSTQFSDGTVGNYTYDGTDWVLDFVSSSDTGHPLDEVVTGTGPSTTTRSTLTYNGVGLAVNGEGHRNINSDLNGTTEQTNLARIYTFKDEFQGGGGAMFIDQISSIGNGAGIVLRRSAGSVSSPTDATNNLQIGYIDFRAYSGDRYWQMGSIDTQVDDYPFISGQAPPCLMRFATNTSNGGSTERMRVNSIGQVIIGANETTINPGMGIYKFGVSHLLNDWNTIINTVPPSGSAYGLRSHTLPTDANSYAIAVSSGAGVGTFKFSARSNGDVHFTGALMPQSDAGLTGQALISQGFGNSPIWQNISQIFTSLTTVTGVNSLSADTNAGSAGIISGGTYKWDDGDAIHIMIKK
jgi:hypothetical protein